LDPGPWPPNHNGFILRSHRPFAHATYAEIDADVPGHREVSDAEVDAVFDRYLAETGQLKT
jgi:hypothetical protein